MKKCNPNKNSKYYMQCFGEWLCTHVDIAYVSGKRLKSFGKRNYYYIFEKLTKTGNSYEMIRLNSYQAAKVYHGKKTVDDFLKSKYKYKNSKFREYISYNYIMGK